MCQSGVEEAVLHDRGCSRNRHRKHAGEHTRTQTSTHAHRQAFMQEHTRIRMSVRSHAQDARMHELMLPGAHVRTGERTDERMQGRTYARVHARVGEQTRMHMSPPAAPTPGGPEIG